MSGVQEQLKEQLRQLESEEQAARMVLASRSTYAWLQHVVWPIVEPGRPFTPGYHLEYLGEHLDAVELGQIRFLMVNTPPRSTKSLLASVAWPTRGWTHHPGTRWLFDSYSDRLALKHSGDRRDVLKHPRYRQHWPQAAIDPKQDAQSEYGNLSAGYMFATSTKGTVTGVGGRIVLDDPMDPDCADSDTQRQSVNLWLAKHFASRFDDPESDPFVIIMQRLHPQDTTQFFLDRADWVHIELDVIPDEPQTYVYPLSGQVWTTLRGQSICPERWSLATVRQISRMLDGTPDMDGPNFMAQYRQQPARAQGAVPVQYFRFWHYPGAPLPPVEFAIGEERPYAAPTIPIPGTDGQIDEEAFDDHCQSWDLSFADTARAADTACTVWSRRGTTKFLRDCEFRRMDFLAQCDAVEAMRARYPRSASATKIENRANGAALLAAKGQEWPGLLPIEPGRQSKRGRLNEVLPQFRAGEVIFPHPDLAPWVWEVIKQLSGQSKKQDVMDSVTQALRGWVAPAVEWEIL